MENFVECLGTSKNRLKVVKINQAARLMSTEIGFFDYLKCAGQCP